MGSARGRLPSFQLQLLRAVAVPRHRIIPSLDEARSYGGPRRFSVLNQSATATGSETSRAAVAQRVRAHLARWELAVQQVINRRVAAVNLDGQAQHVIRFAIVQATVVVDVDHVTAHETRDGHGVEVVSKKRQVIVEHAHVKQVGRKASTRPIVERE